jgi:hypothetical protein
MGTSSRTLFHILGDDGEKGYRLLYKQTNGYLLIDRQLICDVMLVVLSPVICPLLTFTERVQNTPKRLSMP